MHCLFCIIISSWIFSLFLRWLLYSILVSSANSCPILIAVFCFCVMSWSTYVWFVICFDKWQVNLWEKLWCMGSWCKNLMIFFDCCYWRCNLPESMRNHKQHYIEGFLRFHVIHNCLWILSDITLSTGTKRSIQKGFYIRTKTLQGDWLHKSYKQS